MGKNSITNIWQQQKLLKSIEVQQSKNHAELFLYQQTLALWLAVPTSNIEENTHYGLPSLPALPEMGLPAEVLKYRPDIEQAFAKIKEALPSHIQVSERHLRNLYRQYQALLACADRLEVEKLKTAASKYGGLILRAR